MHEARQIHHSLATTNPFNAIPEVQPTRTRGRDRYRTSYDPSAATGTRQWGEPPPRIYAWVPPTLPLSELSSATIGTQTTSTLTSDLSTSTEISRPSNNDSGRSRATRTAWWIGSNSSATTTTTSPTWMPSVTSSRSDWADSSGSSSLSSTAIESTSSTTEDFVFTTTTLVTTTITPTTTSESSTFTDLSLASEALESPDPTSVSVAKATSINNDPPPQIKSTLSPGAIAGITFGSAITAALLAFLLFLCLRRRRREQESRPPSVYPQEAYLYDPPMAPSPQYNYQTPFSLSPSYNTAYQPTNQIPISPPLPPTSPPLRALTPEGERTHLISRPEGYQDIAMLGAWRGVRRSNSVSYRPLGTGRGYKLPPLREDMRENENDPNNPFRDNVI